MKSEGRKVGGQGHAAWNRRFPIFYWSFESLRGWQKKHFWVCFDKRESQRSWLYSQNTPKKLLVSVQLMAILWKYLASEGESWSRMRLLGWQTWNDGWMYLFYHLWKDFKKLASYLTLLFLARVAKGEAGGMVSDGDRLCRPCSGARHDPGPGDDNGEWPREMDTPTINVTVIRTNNCQDCAVLGRWRTFKCTFGKQLTFHLMQNLPQSYCTGS